MKASSFPLTERIIHTLRRLFRNGDLESTPRKILIALPCILTTIVSLLLVVSLKKGWTIDGATQDWVLHNRAETQIAVQIIAGLMGVAQVSTLRNLANYAARRRLARYPMSLDVINLYSALSTSEINWSLSFASLLAVLAAAFLALGPAAIWAGALTPINIAVELPDQTIAVPKYSSRTAAQWNQSWFTVEPTVTTDGTFTYGAIRNLYGHFINDGSTASSLGGGPTIVRKADNSNYTYHGRSYGVGAAVGLFDKQVVKARRLLSYSYFENGYQSLWRCQYNRSSGSHFELTQTHPHIYVAKASSPIASYNDSGYFVADFGRKGNEIVAAKMFPIDVETWKQNYTAPFSYLVSMAQGDRYSSLDKIQCAGSFIPTKFSIVVDPANKIIKATPHSTHGAVNIDETGFIANKAGDTLAALSLVSTTAFTSVLGDMLNSNVFTLNQSQVAGANGSDAYPIGIASSLQALSDLQLFAAAGAQLVITHDSDRVTVSAQLQAMRIGQGAFIYTNLALNAVVVCLVALQALRTRLWSGMPRLNLADVKSMVIASSRGGRSIAQAVDGRHGTSGGRWVGDAGDRKAGVVKVLLEREEAGPALSMAA